MKLAQTFSQIIAGRVRDATDAGMSPLQVIATLLSHAAAFHVVVRDHMPMPPFLTLAQAAEESASEKDADMPEQSAPVESSTTGRKVVH